MTSTWDTIRSTVAATLRARRAAMLATWERTVLGELPALGPLGGTARADHVPELFARIIDVLAGDSADDIPIAVTAHATQRVAAGVGAHVVMAEYAGVGRVLRDELFAIVPVEALHDAVVVLDRTVDRWACAAVVACARYLDDARERLVAILAHDLRTPLSCIAMAAEMLSASRDRELHARGLHAQILSAADRMKRMITDVLDLARNHVGHELPITARPDDLGEICREALAELSVAYPERSITLEARGDLQGMFDRDRVEQAVANLVRNAIEHGIGGVHVRATEAADHHALLIEVTNRRRADASGALPILGSRSDGRTGFGLYIVHTIAAAHGATCTHDSTTTETTYTIRWPRTVERRGSVTYTGVRTSS